MNVIAAVSRKPLPPNVNVVLELLKWLTVRLLAQDDDRLRSFRLDSGGDLDWRPGPLPDADPGHPREADLAAGARDRQLTKTRRERRSLATTRPQRRDHNADRVVGLEGDKRRCLPHDLREPSLDRLTCPA